MQIITNVILTHMSNSPIVTARHSVVWSWEVERANTNCCIHMSDKAHREVKFKALQVFNVGGSAKLELQAPKVVHYANAKGGLRTVDPDEVRTLAKASATALASLTLGTPKT